MKTPSTRPRHIHDATFKSIRDTVERTAARGPSLDAEGRALRRLPYRGHDVLAQAVAQSLADAYRRGTFPFS